MSHSYLTEVLEAASHTSLSTEEPFDSIMPMHPVPPHFTPAHSMMQHAMPPHPMPPHAMLSHPMLPHAMPPHAMPPHIMPPHAMPPHPMPLHPMPPHPMPSHPMQPHALQHLLMQYASYYDPRFQGYTAYSGELQQLSPVSNAISSGSAPSSPVSSCALQPQVSLQTSPEKQLSPGQPSTPPPLTPQQLYTTPPQQLVVSPQQPILTTPHTSPSNSPTKLHQYGSFIYHNSSHNAIAPSYGYPVEYGNYSTPFYHTYPASAAYLIDPTSSAAGPAQSSSSQASAAMASQSSSPTYKFVLESGVNDKILTPALSTPPVSPPHPALPIVKCEKPANEATRRKYLSHQGCKGDSCLKCINKAIKRTQTKQPKVDLVSPVVPVLLDSIPPTTQYVCSGSPMQPQEPPQHPNHSQPSQQSQNPQASQTQHPQIGEPSQLSQLLQSSQPAKLVKDHQPHYNRDDTRSPVPMSDDSSKPNEQILVLPLVEASALFSSVPYFMGEFGTHGQEVHMIAKRCANVESFDRRYPNPRKEGLQLYELNQSFVDANPKFIGKNIPMWRERIYCKGKHNCAANPTAVNVKHRSCSVEIICTIWSKDPTKMEIRSTGTHGPHHNPPTHIEARKQNGDKLSYKVDQFIKREIAVNPAITPTQIHIAVTTTLKDKFRMTKCAPTLMKIINRVHYLRRQGDLHTTDCAKLHDLLDDPEAQQYVLFPKNKVDYPSATNTEWCIVFSNQAMLSTLAAYGQQICGVDGNFKFTKYRMPFWAVVTEDTHHNAAPGAFILGSNDNANVLGCGLRKIHEAMQGKWDPDWCIDKDEKEFKSIKDVNKDIFTGEIFLCNFHAARTWRKALLQRVKDPVHRKALLAKIHFIQRAHTRLQVVGRSILLRLYCDRFPEDLKGFKIYFDENWLCPKWRRTWIDLFRPHHWGLYNTNNFSETTFRKMGRLFFLNKARMTISRLVKCLTNIVIPYYNEIQSQKIEGRIPVAASYQERKESVLKEYATEIIRDGLISQCHCTCTSDKSCSCGFHDDLFRCYSQRNNKFFYWVNLFNTSCTCGYYCVTGRTCKHLFAAVLVKEGTTDNVVEGLSRVTHSDDENSDDPKSPPPPPDSAPDSAPDTPANSNNPAISAEMEALQKVAADLKANRDPISILTSLSNLLAFMPEKPNVADIPAQNNKKNAKNKKQKTPYSPEQPGRPEVATSPYRFPTHRKRGPGRSRSLDGKDHRQPKSYDNIVDIVNCRGVKKPQIAVTWRDHTTSWEPSSAVLQVPRLQKLYQQLLCKKEQDTKTKRQQQYQQKKAKKIANQSVPTSGSAAAVEPLATNATSTPESSVKHSQLPSPSNGDSPPLTSDASASTSTTAVPEASPSNPLQDISNATSASVSYSTPPVTPTKNNQQKNNSPTQSPNTRKRKTRSPASSPDQRPPPAYRKPRAPSSSPDQRPDQRPLPAYRKTEANTERRINMIIPAAPDIPEDHLLCLPPYSLSPWMVQQVLDRSIIQLVSVKDLVPAVEYDRAKHGKNGEDPVCAIRTMQKALQNYGVGDEVLLVYSYKDHKAYVTEGNLRIAAAKNMPELKYLPARVITTGEPTPRHKGVPCTKLGKKDVHNCSPRDIGFKVASYEL